MPFSIRRATESDGPALIALRRVLFSETDNMLWEPDEFVQTADDESKRIARLNSRSNSLVILAEQDSNPIGILTAVGGDVRRLRKSASLALGVAKAHWGQGVATQMLQTALDWSRASGLRRVELTVHTSNIRALSVYLRCGFQVEGVRRSSLFVGGVYVDEYMMSVINEVQRGSRISPWEGLIPVLAAAVFTMAMHRFVVVGDLAGQHRRQDRMLVIPRGFIGRLAAVLWLVLCLAVLVFGFVQREVHDMPIAFVWFLVSLSFPLGAGAVVVLGVVLGSSGAHYVPFWSELPLWAAAVSIGYWQWFVLVPALVRSISSRKDNAAWQVARRSGAAPRHPRR